MENQIGKMIGIEVGSHSVRAVILVYEKGQWRISRFSEVPLGAGQVQNPLREACFEAIGTMGSALVVSCMPAMDVLVRQLDIPVSKEKEIQAVRDFQVEPLLPFSIEEAVLDHEVLERKEEGSRLVVLSVLKERLAEHLERMKGAGIEPERLSCGAVGLARLVHHLVPSNEPVGVLHLGGDATSCLIVRGGKVVRARVIPLGSAHIKEALPKEMGFDFMNFEPSNSSPINQRAEAFRAEIAKTFFSITHRGRETISQIYVSGEFDSFRNLDVYLSQALEHPIIQLPQRSPLFEHDFRTARYAVPLGILLDHLPKAKGGDRRFIDFRQGLLAYPRPWKRARKRIAAYVTACLLSSGLLLAGGEGVIQKKGRTIQRDYSHLAGAGEDLLEGARAKLRKLNQEVEGYPLKPDLPKVGEVLTWLEEHPQMEGIRVEHFHYVLQKRPDHRRPQERYQAKVELELKTTSPTKARELHDALLGSNEMIDPGHELVWNAQGDRALASFVLRDRTRYPGRKG